MNINYDDSLWRDQGITELEDVADSEAATDELGEEADMETDTTGPTDSPDVLQYPVLDIPAQKIRARVDNPNAMDEPRYNALKRLIERYGFLEPVLVRPLPEPDGEYEYEMVQGHHRMRAMVELGHTVIPCIVRDLSDEEAVALQIGMNRVRGELDLQAVARTLDELSAHDWEVDDLTMLGFTESELADMLSFANADSDASVAIDGAVALPEEEKVDRTRWVLELEFRSKEEMVAVRKALGSMNRDMGLAVHALLGLQ